MNSLAFLIPGDWNVRTGGYGYDRRLVQALRQAGWAVDVHHLVGDWPYPGAAARSAAADLIASLADGRMVVIDGLAGAVLADEVRPHATRLRWVALVHHPLHLEIGLDETARSRLRLAEADALQLVRQVVVTGAATVQDLEAMGVASARIAVVEPGTDPILPKNRSPRGTGPIQLLCVATLTPRKGHAFLLQALSGLGELPWELHNVGSTTRDPVTAAALVAASAPWGARVQWHGELTEAAVQARFAAADVFVLPSLHEGYGMVVAEALAHGLPVVATNAGALAHTLPSQAGLHVNPGNALALREALARVIEDTPLREQLAAGARDAAARLPDWPRQAAAFARVLELMP
ncbi:glycosyltransferase family 4 protein [Hydrogenophaga sp.]|uniref:glycosyltransferase family 4 protein n=1 Tax=Hydrogenophaga sp. TaxID=1904254 RepID=UPI003F701F4C